MDIKFSINVSKEYEEAELVLNVKEITENVKFIEENIKKIINTKTKIIGTIDYDIYLIDVNDIVMFFSDDKHNYCKTEKQTFKIKEKLYYLEEYLPKNNFIRISNQVIANINYIKCFDTSIIGKIIVKFKDGSIKDVSRRRTKEILKLLKGELK